MCHTESFLPGSLTCVCVAIVKTNAGSLSAIRVVIGHLICVDESQPRMLFSPVCVCVCLHCKGGVPENVRQREGGGERRRTKQRKFLKQDDTEVESVVCPDYSVQSCRAFRLQNIGC